MQSQDEIVANLTARALGLVRQQGSRPVGHLVARKNLLDFCLLIGFDGTPLREEEKKNYKYLYLNNDFHIFYYERKGEGKTLSLNHRKKSLIAEPAFFTVGEKELSAQQELMFSRMDILLGSFGFSCDDYKLVPGDYAESSNLIYTNPKDPKEKYGSSVAVPAAFSIIRDAVNLYGKDVMAGRTGPYGGR